MRLLAEMRAQLIIDGLVRDPDVGGDKPPLWLSPFTGLNAPGEGEQPQHRSALVVGAEPAPGIPPSPREEFLRHTAVDFTFRARKAPTILDFWELLYHALAGRTNWPMGGMLISQVQLMQDLQPLANDEQGYRYRAQWIFTWQDFELAADRGWGS